MIALVKTLHIAALVMWCAGLIALPLLLGTHRTVHAAASHAQVQKRYTRFRQLTYMTYTALVTPAAVIAIVAGTVLIFAAQVFEIWLLVKLLCVAGMVLVHAWLGYLIVQSGERAAHWRMPWPQLALLMAVPCMLGVLALVLVKPDLASHAQELPDWLTQPRDVELDEVLQVVTDWLGLDAPKTQEPLP